MKASGINLNNRHLVKPVIHHGKTWKKLSTTRHKRGTHHKEVSVTIPVEGDKLALELRLNRALLPEGHVISYREADRTVLHRPNNEEIELCQYTGRVREKHNSWVAVSTCYGLRGAIYDGTKIRYIEPVKENNIDSLHHIYEHNFVGENQTCGYNVKSPEETDNQLPKRRLRRQKRDASFPNRGFFYANDGSRYIELVLVADHAQYLGADRNLKVLHHQLQETTNIANAIFSPHNVFIALTGIEVWTVENRISLDSNTQTTLQRFSEYLTILFKNIGNHDHAQLVTETFFHQGHAGIAYVDSMCSPGSCSVIYRSPRNVTAATIVKTAYNMIHELGHSLGMRHDSENCKCLDAFCIMSGIEQSYLPTRWSDCSLRVLRADYAGGNYSSCLRNKPVHLFGSPSCGNGFIDPGEQCDCGVTMDNDSRPCYKCCDPETCMFRSNATCVGGVCCNIQMCQFKPAGTVCRAAEIECDLPEYCTGHSELCPEDVIKMDAIPCSGELCARQRCVSVDHQRLINRHKSQACLANCSGHGVCNSNGYCHCDDGYAPPMCDLPGFGGSVDSGPARHSESHVCSCDHRSEFYDSVPTVVNKLRGTDIYIAAVTSVSAVIAFVFLIYLIKFLYHNIIRSRIRSFNTAKKVNRDKPKTSNINQRTNVQRMEITPEMLSSVRLKKVKRSKYMYIIESQDEDDSQ